jgi:glycine cleavage system H protein
MTPRELKYTKDHEWVKVDGTKAVVGITDHAQKSLGDITFVEIPSVGKVVAQHQELGVIESVKAASDLYAPIAGKVTQANAALARRPEIINQSPYGEGWVCKLEQVDATGLANLMDAEQYDAYVAKL